MSEGGTKRYRIMVGSMSWAGMMAASSMMCGRRRMVKTGRWKPMTRTGQSEGGTKRYRIMVGSMSWAGGMAST